MDLCGFIKGIQIVLFFDALVDAVQESHEDDGTDFVFLRQFSQGPVHRLIRMIQNITVDLGFRFAVFLPEVVKGLSCLSFDQLRPLLE